MPKISRSRFIKQSFGLGAAVSLPLFAQDLFSQTSPVNTAIDTGLMQRLIQANDQQAARLLQMTAQSPFSRRTGYDLATLTAAYCAAGSRYYQNTTVVTALEKLAQQLLSVQAADGTVDIGNLESPPDTAFLLEPVCAAASLLNQQQAAALQQVKADLKKFILKAGEALSTGGIHTPNHRWVVSAALARIHTLYPNAKYLDRINDWLDEGVFIDEDGNFPERSRNYAIVEDGSLLTIARLLNRPRLLEPVRKNLEATYYYMEPDGDLVVNDSRRQDQYTAKTIVSYYPVYRYMAIYDRSGLFAAITQLIEGMKGFEEEILNRLLFTFLEDPLLQKELPAASPLPLNYEKLFRQANLLRMRRGPVTATLFGGVDWPLVIASGRSNSPNFYAFRKGNAVLKYMRLSTSFFSTGYFYSEGIQKVGNSYVLHKKLDVPYYQPLLKNKRNAKGDYKLSPSIDDRFWNKMDFSNRPVSNVKTLQTTIRFSDKAGSNELLFEVSGQPGVAVTIELCFQEGGKLTGVAEGANQNFFLEQGMGEYTWGNDTIRFGPGTVRHKTIINLEGERYSTHFGSLRTPGMHVYLTGVTPFSHSLTFS